MTKDLTQGKITPLLVKFTIPLLFGNIFQLMYNSVDSIIVGQLVGKEALAAVGTSNPLMTLAILFVNGMCIGASILMGTQYGAKKMDVLKRQISTTMIAGIVFSIAVTLFCILFARPLLLLIRVQEEVLPLAVSYLRIVFLGFIFTFIYNFFAGIRVYKVGSAHLYCGGARQHKLQNVGGSGYSAHTYNRYFYRFVYLIHHSHRHGLYRGARKPARFVCKQRLFCF